MISPAVKLHWTVPPFRMAHDAEWKEEQHKRGQPGNAGQFGSGGGAAKSAPEKKPSGGEKSNGGGEKKAAGVTKPQPVPPSPGPQTSSLRQSASGVSQAGHPGHGYSDNARVVNGVIQTDNVNDAVRALYEGKKVALDQPRQVSTLVARLGGIAKRMEKLGLKAPNFDLCNVAVANTNLFCAETKGIPRVKMPQLPDEKAGEFQKFLQDKGYAAEVGQEKAAYLKATQSELVGVKVSGIMGYFRNKPASEDPPLFISKDNYIVDGHHRWAARVGLDAENNMLGQGSVNVVRVNLPIIDLLAEAEDFTGGRGHKAATANDARKKGAGWTSLPFRR